MFSKIHIASTGTGGLDPGVVAGAILRGLKNATALPLNSLVKVRLVFLKIRVFLAFKEEATQMFSTAVINRGKKKNQINSFFFTFENSSHHLQTFAKDHTLLRIHFAIIHF